MTANTVRGEQMILIEGHSYTMRPSFQAIQAFEDQLGMSAIELGLKAEQGKLRGIQIAIIVTECVRADLRHQGKGREADAWKAETVAEKLMEADGGLLAAITLMPPFLRAVITGGYTAKGEAKAVAEEKAGDANAMTDTPAAA